MKEKTFEELIEEMNTGGRIPYGIVLSLMQKVREATIAECMEIYEEDWGKYTGYKLMEALPTDRIKIEL